MLDFEIKSALVSVVFTIFVLEMYLCVFLKYRLRNNSEVAVLIVM